MKFFDDDETYKASKVKEIMKISNSTLEKCCNGGLKLTRLPISGHRRFKGSDLNEFFKETE